MNSTVTMKGQIVIPSRLRHRYGIKSGTRVHFYDDEKKGEIRIIPITPEVIEKNFGFLRTNGRLSRALMEEKKLEREL